MNYIYGFEYVFQKSYKDAKLYYAPYAITMDGETIMHDYWYTIADIYTLSDK